MYILLLAPQPFFTHRGTPIAIQVALQALSDQGHRIDVLSYHLGEDVAIANVRHLRIARPPLVNRVPIGPSWQKAVCDVYLLAKAARLVRSHAYDLIHAVEESAFIAGLLRRFGGPPFVYDMDSQMSAQLRDKSFVLWPLAWIFGGLERRTIRRSLGVLAVCQILADIARPEQPAHHVVLLPDIPLTGTLSGRLPDALTAAPGVRILYVGNLERYQGIDLLLAAFALIADTCPRASLILVGGAAHHIAHYRRHCPALVQAGRVRFVGPIPIEQLGAVLAHADILVSPRTKGINTPMKIYSYLQSGKAVLATRLPTHSQVLHDEVAMLADPTPAAMARGLQALIEDPALRRALGQRGQLYNEANFSEAVFRRRLRDFYDHIGTLIAVGEAPASPATGNHRA